MATKKEEKKLTEVKENATVDVILQEKAKKTRENLSQGGKPVIVNTVDAVEVEFTEDYGFIKKGSKQKVSMLALEIYQKAGVVEKI